jgi:hypothetical protein
MLRRPPALLRVRCAYMLCPAVDEDAKRFYARHGLAESPLEPLTRVLGLKA